MPGTVIRQHRYTREEARKHIDRLYLFGDNLAGWGNKGQACIRGLANARGVPTKRRPSDEPNAFFNDRDFRDVAELIDEAFDAADTHLKVGGDVVIPADGLGTGLAQLQTRAPSILAYIEDNIRGLEERYGSRREE